MWKESFGIEKHSMTSDRFDNRYTRLDKFVAEIDHLLDTRTDMLSGSWTRVVSNVEAEGTIATLTHEEGSVPDARFYRVQVSYVEL